MSKAKGGRGAVEPPNLRVTISSYFEASRVNPTRQKCKTIGRIFKDDYRRQKSWTDTKG